MRAGFFSRCLATLYDLEVIHEKAIEDWLQPPDNRDPFLTAARKRFDVRDNIEAKKQVGGRGRGLRRGGGRDG